MDFFVMLPEATSVFTVDFQVTHHFYPCKVKEKIGGLR